MQMNSEMVLGSKRQANVIYCTLIKSKDEIRFAFFIFIMSFDVPYAKHFGHSCNSKLQAPW
jgi:hypothetical protein